MPVQRNFQQGQVIVAADRLRALTDTQLRLALGAPEVIFARVGADQKRRIVEALKQKGRVVRSPAMGSMMRRR